MTPRLVDLDSVEVESGVAASEPHHGFVHLRCRSAGEVLVGQLDTVTASALGLQLIEAAMAADGDSALFRLLAASNIDHNHAASILTDLRALRSQPEEPAL